MTPQDKARLTEWHLTDVEFESDKCVHDLLEAQALLTPDKTAVICRDRSVTYRDLWGKAGRLAMHLRELGVGPEIIVAIMMDRSLDMMVALLGVLKTGGAYLPLDPAFPAERITFMLKDSDAHVALTQSSYRNRLAESSATVIAVDEFDFEHERTDSRGTLTNVQLPSSLAYLIYTSGSTGTPKGVMVEHRNVVSFFAGMDRVIGVEQGVWLAVTSISFDISGLELLWTLSRGFTVVLQTGENGLAATGDYSIAAQIARHGVTHFQCTPTLAGSLVRFPETIAAMRTLRKVLIGGEAFPLSLANWLRNAISAEIFNMYGPTETTVWSTTHKLVGTAGSVPIGKPIANTRIYIVDEQGKLAPLGATGELYIGGAGVTRGYFRRPELTAERFIANSFDPERDGKLYRTGDLARYRDDGQVEFLGRSDQQVKIRGFRIELGEIETVLGAYFAVQEAIVVAQRDRADNLQLVAYVVPKPGVSVSPHELKIHAQKELPEYMIPAAVRFLSAMPLTPNGKTDRKALPSLSHDANLETEKGGYASTELERIIAELWQSSLGLDVVGLQVNLFDLGANSLSVAEVAMSLRQRLKREIPLTDFFACPTIAALAAHLSDSDGRTGNSKDLGDRGAARRQALLARTRVTSANGSEASK
jgi:amino acid adenylation domain-containing protein